MNPKQLFEAIGHVDEELLERSERAKKGHRRPRWMGTVAAALAIVLLGGLAFRPMTKSAATAAPAERLALADNSMAPAADAPAAMDKVSEEAISENAVVLLASPVLPERAPYPDERMNTDTDYRLWKADLDANIHLDSQLTRPLEPYFRNAIRVFLDGEAGENRVCSPLNTYLALGMLAQVTDGNSRAQVLSALGEPSMETLQSRAEAIWQASYRNDGATNCNLANSLWLREGMGYNSETLSLLGSRFYASAFRGTMGSPELNDALRGWLNDQTGGKLAEQLADVELDDRTVLALASTLLYEAKWQNPFFEELTTEGPFHGAPGEETVSYLHSVSANTYYWGDGFTAVGLEMANWGGKLWLVLPDEGLTPEMLLQGDTVLDFLLSRGDWDNQKRLTVELTMPRYDISSKLDLRDALKKLNITDVFDPTVSDFTPLTDEIGDLFLDQVRHDVRFTADEEGVSAAAVTLMTVRGNGMPPQEQVCFTLDRPFLFLLSDSNSLPLFAGIVNSCA